MARRSLRILERAAQLGIDLRRFGQSLQRVSWFIDTVNAYRSARPCEGFPLELERLRPMLLDRDRPAGGFDPHYFHQDLWAARRIHSLGPRRHLDVGSRIDGFVSHLLTFMPVMVLDVRPLPSNVQGLEFVQGDATDMRPFDDESVESLSCLHALEHFGLGRYGDPVRPDAWARALSSFFRVLEPGGRLYLSTPVGRQRLEFNAHRVFAPETILHALRGLQLQSFAAVGDDGVFHEDVSPSDFKDAWYACGMFEFRKPVAPS
jgi:SAM-dependent methyltransferase